MLEIFKEAPERKLVATIFVPFTREWLVDDFLENFDQINFGPRSSVELVFYNDTNNESLREKLLSYFKGHEKEFAAMRLYTSGNAVIQELGDENHVKRRRDRIVTMKEKSKEFIGDSMYTFCLEDDTFPPANAFWTLLTHMYKPNVGLVSGVEQARWALKVIGLWEISPLNDPTTVRTVAYRDKGVQNVDGTGWYCYITKTELYKAATYRYEADCLGPDVCYAWDLRKQGINVLADWSIRCNHKSQWGDYYPDKESQVVTYTKDGGNWVPKIS